MPIWGKIVGAAAGTVLAGLPGLLVGAGLGHAIDAGYRGSRNDASDGADQKITFTIGVIALAAKMAKADGIVTDDEVEAFKDVFQVPPQEVRNVARVFDMARQDTAGYETYARQVAALFKDRPAILEDLLDALFHIAAADGHIHPNELDYLRNVAERFGFEEAEFERISARHVGPDRSSPYVILGISSDISDEELRATYKRLIKENHPDRLIAQGLPREFIKVANERLAAINAAYDRIAVQRGLN